MVFHIRIVTLLITCFCILTLGSASWSASCKKTFSISKRGAVPGEFFNDSFFKAVAQKQTKKSIRAPIPLSAEMNEFRQQTLSFLKNNEISRETIVSLYESRILQQSVELKAQLSKLDSIEYDLVIQGGGIHGVIGLLSALKENPQLKVLLIEKSDVIASNFRKAGDGFSINSSNRRSGPGLKPLPGEGNINELPNFPVQVSDVSAKKYPSSNDLASTAIIAAYAAMIKYPNVDILLREKVTSLFKFEDGRVINEVSTESLPAISYQKLAVASGLGKPSFPPAVEKAIEELPRLRANIRGKKIQRISSFEDVIRAINSTENPKELFANKTVVVVGKGDSANVLVEFLLGYAPRAAYGLDSAQIKLPKKIIWIGQNQNTCEKFLETARSRYVQINTGFRSSSPKNAPILVGMPGRVDSSGKKKATRIDSNDNLITLVDGEPVRSDIAVYATGYRNGLYELLPVEYYQSVKAKNTNLKKRFENATEFLKGKTSVSNGKNTNIGRVLKGSNDIVFIGPGAGALAKKSELFGVIQNFVSIFNNAPRTQSAMAKLLAGFESISLKNPDGARNPITTMNDKKKNLSVDYPSEPRRISNLDAEKFFKESIFDLVETFEIKSSGSQSLFIEIKQLKSGKGIKWNFKGIDGNLSTLKAQIQSNRALLSLIQALLNAPEATAISIEIPVKAKSFDFEKTIIEVQE